MQRDFYFRQLAFSNDILDQAKEKNFDLQGYIIKAQPEQCRRPRKVNSII